MTGLEAFGFESGVAKIFAALDSRLEAKGAARGGEGDWFRGGLREDKGGRGEGKKKLMSRVKD